MRVWLNGQVLHDPSVPAISIADHGLTVGDGVFETVKAVAGVPFAMGRHLQRLQSSAAGLGLPVPDVQEIVAATHDLLAGQDWPLARVRITFTGGEGPMGSGRGDAGPTTLIVAAPMQPMPDSTTAITVPWARNERGALAGLKTTSYAENVVALARASERNATEALFANTVGHLCEGTGSNIFYVLDGELVTPTLQSGCLAGVTRALVIDWSGATEVDHPIEVLAQASEAFLVSTTRDVQALTRIDDRDYGAMGEITRAARAMWQRREAETSEP